MIITMPEVWDRAVARHGAYVRRIIAAALQPTAASISSHFLRNLIVQNTMAIAVGKPDTLETLIDQVQVWRTSTLTTDKDREEFESESKRIFDYKTFSDKQTKGWNAFELCKLSSHKLCPYCQQSYAFTMVTRDKPKVITRGKRKKKRLGSRRGFRPTLDHFFPKSAHPYLALSLYNLVPACQVCNSSLKSQTDFYKHKHLHPLRDDECLSFELGAEEYLSYRQDPRVGLGLKAVVTNPAKRIEAEASIETFLLNKRYSAHTMELARWMESLRHWSPSKISRLAQQFNVQGADEMARFEAMLFNFDRNDHRYELLGRIKLDLYEAVQADRASTLSSVTP